MSAWLRRCPCPGRDTRALHKPRGRGASVVVGEAVFADAAVDELADDVEVSGVAGVLLEDVEQDPLERRGRAAAEGLLVAAGEVGELRGLDDRPCSLGARGERPR